MQNCIVYLIGYAGTGKYTVAKELVKRAHFILVDNHLINNPIFSVVEADGKKPLPLGVWREVRKIRDAVLNAVMYLTNENTNFIFTNELIDNHDGKSWFNEIWEIADARGATFLPVRLTVNPEEHFRRVISVERAERFKETNPESLKNRMELKKLLRPDYPHLLELDITHISASEAARMIEEKLSALVQKKE